MSRSARASRFAGDVVRQTWPLLAIVIIALAGLGFLIFHPEGLLNRHSDLLAENLGTQTVFHDAWQSSHRLPLWRSDMLSGGPALTNPQSLYTHPFHVLFALFQPVRVVGLVIWLQMVLAALGAYYAGTVLRLSVPARVMVAVAMLFSFKTIAAVYGGWLTVLAGIAAMPLLFATVTALVQSPTLKSALIAGAAGALALHSGHPQLTYYTALFLALWAGGRIVRLLLSGDSGMAARVFISLAGVAAVAVGLTAYLLIPLLYELGSITRVAASYEFLTGGAPPIYGLWTLLDPEVSGTPLGGTFVGLWEYVVYFGAVPSFLLVVGAAKSWRDPFVRALAAGLLLTLLMAIDSPLLKFVYAVVPGYSLFRLPARILFLSAFFAYCLAGFGFDHIRAATRTRLSRVSVATALIAFVALEGTFWARRYLREPHPIPFAPGGAYVDAMDGGKQAERVAPLSRSVPNYGSAAALGMQLVSGYDPFNQRHYGTYMDVLRYGRPLADRAIVWTDVDAIARLDMLAALNVRYVTSPEPIELPSTDYTLAGMFSDQTRFLFNTGRVTGPVYFYRNERFQKRAFFVSDVRNAGDVDGMTNGVLNADIRETAIVVGAESGASPAAVGDRVDVLHSEGGVLDLATHNANRRFLVISEVWNPGWRVRVDGHAVPVYQADIALQGLWLEPGDHRVSLHFWPVGLTLGLIVTGVTALGVLGASAFLFIRHRRGAR